MLSKRFFLNVRDLNLIYKKELSIRNVKLCILMWFSFKLWLDFKQNQMSWPNIFWGFFHGLESLVCMSWLQWFWLRPDSHLVIFVAIMNCMNVLLQTLCMRKWYTTRITFVIFVAFMNCVNMYLQISHVRKWFTRRFTFVIFAAFLNCIHVLSSAFPSFSYYECNQGWSW